MSTTNRPTRPIKLAWALSRRTPLKRKTALVRKVALARRTPLRRRRPRGASEAQRDKVAGQRCLVCGSRPVDPAHLVARARGGCDHRDCVVALCRSCHRAFDQGQLDLLAHLEPHSRRELAHALSHLSLVSLLQRLTAEWWGPAGAIGVTRQRGSVK